MIRRAAIGKTDSKRKVRAIWVDRAGFGV